jgi:hypothetical protein
MRPQTVTQVRPDARPRPRRLVLASALLALVVVAATLAIGTAAPAGATGGESPKGSLDRLVLTFPGGQPTAVAEGWSFDPDTPTSPTRIGFKLNGSFVGASRSVVYRPDVAAAFSGAGSNHGYSLSRALPEGTHRICTVGVNTAGTGGANTTLGCGTVTVLGVRGSVDTAVLKNGLVRVTGWAIDGTRSTAVNVRISNWAGSVTVPAGGYRPDVGAAFSGYGSKHGFATTLNANAGPVCVDVLNASNKSIGRIGCRAVVNLDAPPPVSWRDSMLWAVNKERANRGVAPLAMCPALNNAAQGYAETLRANSTFSHFLGGSTPASRMAAAGYQWTRSGENIAAGQPDVYNVMIAWVYSPGHFKNIVDPGFQHVGFGSVPRSGGGSFWVQDFGAGTCP